MIGRKPCLLSFRSKWPYSPSSSEKTSTAFALIDFPCGDPRAKGVGAHAAIGSTILVGRKAFAVSADPRRAAVVGLTCDRPPLEHGLAVRLIQPHIAGHPGLAQSHGAIMATTIGISVLRYRPTQQRHRVSILRGPVSHAAGQLGVSRERFPREQRQSRYI
ncbi:MAG: hypothetical protein JWM91_4683 [Rhodospirillales bacterium]|nr:hypothetical protein [Rhodospirillales bacterium]